MNDSVGSTIEKIKILEQDTENKLKEKREYEATIAALNQAIKEALQQTKKLHVENAQLIEKIDSLKAKLVLERIRRDALIAQIEVSKKELQDLNNESDKGIGKVWKIRADLCTAIQKVSDECDIRALLIKPTYSEFNTTHTDRLSQEDLISANKERLKNAIERRNKALSIRATLQAEPDEGEEYIRIRNALQYSLDMVSNLRK